jgi:quercetin dioxygenase-like cupin family protein
MKTLTHLIGGVLFITLILSIGTQKVMAQDAVKVAPQNYKVLLENDQMRVLEFRAKPGVKEPMHTHPAGFIYWFSAGKAKATFPDGKTTESEIKAGQINWREPVTHTWENLAKTEAHALIVELKGPAEKPTK